MDPVSANRLGSLSRTKTTPIPVNRTNRPIVHRVLTSMPAGKMVPLMAIPLLREDSCSGSYRVAFEMLETVEVLMNAINVRVMAYLVPKLAFDRFDGLDSINRSYEGVNFADGRPSPAWFETQAAGAPGTNKIHYYMGKHARTGQLINTDYIEAYNQIWNFRAKNRSQDLALRNRLDTTLAPAFWQHQTFAHIVPDFDQAIIDGEVPLNVANAKMPVKGLGLFGTAYAPNASTTGLRQAGDTTETAFTGAYKVVESAPNAAVQQLYVKTVGTAAGAFPDIWAELQDNGITISLSNIELARKTQAFANLRRQYAGHSDEYIIDLLMDGITIPDAAWKQPMLLADVSTVFGMNKRWASDGQNLTESVVNGVTFVDLRINCPRVPVGGVIMLVAEISPEQLFERQKDPYLHATTVDQLPAFLRDTLDPEKVEVVTNDAVDVDHDTPNGTFGYAPLNWAWAKSMPQIGGKFFRPAADETFDEDRQRIWAVETKNPVLSTDFYLTTTMHYKPFVITDDAVDHFEAMVRGSCNIRGNTVLGPALIEASDDYDKVLAEAPMDRIEKPATAETGEPDLPGQQPA